MPDKAQPLAAANLFALDEYFVDPDKDWLTELVGEGRKFQDPQALARSKAEADAYAARIENENKGLRNELAQRVKFEEFLDKVNSGKGDDDDTHRKAPTETHALQKEDIERLLEQKMNQRDQARIAEQNLNIVAQKLRETLGPNFAQRLEQQATELGMTKQAINEMAARNPKAFFKLMGIDEKAVKRDSLFEAPMKGHSTFVPSALSGSKGKSYYDEIYTKNNNLYWSPKIQNEIFERVKEIGPDAFNNS